MIEETKAWDNAGFGQSEALADFYWRFMEAPGRETIRPLVGAGLGLTPTGDDFLQGLIMIEKLTGNDSYKLEETVLGILPERSTTDVSRAYYRVLAKGYVNYNWLRLFSKKARQGRRLMVKYLEEVQAFGATSGNDTLVGLHGYLALIFRGNY